MDDGLITENELNRAKNLATGDAAHPSVTYHLVKLGVVEPEDLVVKLGQFFNVQGVNLAGHRIPETTLELLPSETIRDHMVVPVHKEEGKLYVAMADPSDLDTIDALQFATDDLEIVPLVVDAFSLESFITSRFQNQGWEMDELVAEMDDVEQIEVVGEEEEDVTEVALQEEVDSAPVVRFINGVLHQAVRQEASDIHFEFYEQKARVRFRIDGALIQVARPPKNLHRAITSRLKIMSDLDIGERRRPQDGRTRLKIGNRQIDFRVSTLPTSFGEKVVLRILDKSIVSLDLDVLGVDDREKQIILQTIQSPYGMLLVTGPTGSGKTTTLYSILSRLNKIDVNIITVEDPIEYDLQGINQTTVRPQIGLDFAKALRAFLRQDPDIIMVGEIRDAETASIGVRAALTGHLVLSTLHTNDSASTITRLTEMGVEKFNISSAVKAIIAQRLVRQICPRCKTSASYSPQQLRYARLSEDEAERIPFQRGTGCDYCNNTGYKGRIGLFEVLPVTNEIAEMIIQGSTASEIKQQAIRDGMKTLRMAGMQKVKEGKTTLEEVMKQTTVEF